MIDSYILRHKNRDIALLTLDTETAELHKSNILIPNELPVIADQNGRCISSWLNDRAIPNGRKELQELLKNAGCQTPQEYLVKNLALGLTDCYWLCPASIPELKWENVSLFTHTGHIMEFHDGQGRAYYNSSSAAVNGSLPKQAIYENGGWILEKHDERGSGEGLRNINEAFASYLHQKQGFGEFVNYELTFKDGICDSCKCKYFTDEKHEFVSAYDTLDYYTFDGGANELEKFKNVCVENGLNRDYVNNFMDYQIMTDFLLTNTDRHWGNFGILRDPDTLKFISMAPIFDSGTSMVWNDPYINNRLALLRLETTGIEKGQSDQLNLVKNKSVIKTELLPSKQETEEFYVSRGVSEKHAEQIADCFQMKCDMTKELQLGFLINIPNEIEHAGNPPYKNGTPNPLYMQQIWHEYFETPKNERTKGILWEGKRLRTAVFEDKYLALCQEQGVQADHKIYDHFWKNCVAVQEYSPKYCSEKGKHKDIHKDIQK